MRVLEVIPAKRWRNVKTGMCVVMERVNALGRK